MLSIKAFIAGHKKVAASVAVGVLALASYFGVRSLTNDRERIYDGRVGEWRVIYEEGKDDNYMAARKGRVLFRYYDTDAISGLDIFSKDAKELKDKLERVVYEDGKREETFVRDEIDESRFDAESRKTFFNEADAQYNSLRTQIRDMKRKEVNDSLDSIKSTLK